MTSQAASSGRMADLLGGELTAGFIGFEAVSRGMGREEEGEEGEEEGGVEEVSHGTGAQFQVVMKQLGKRDTTTKLKVEATLCNNLLHFTAIIHHYLLICTGTAGVFWFM